MDHIESAIKVYYTRDYSRFRTINGNRQLNNTKIKKIIKDIENGVDVLRFCPIMVRDNGKVLEIIDGQHRFYVSRKVNTNVWYILAEQMSLHEIAKINSNTEKWNAQDFINCYVQLENKNYIILRDLLDKYPLSVSDGVSLLGTGTVKTGGSDKIKFQEGNFEAKCSDKAEEVLSQAGKFNFKEKYKRHFLAAIEKVLDGNKINLQDLVEKVNANASALEKQATYKDYLLNLETIFNKGRHTRVVIY